MASEAASWTWCVDEKQTERERKGGRLPGKGMVRGGGVGRCDVKVKKE